MQGNQCDLYTCIMYTVNTVLMNEWISQTEFKIKMNACKMFSVNSPKFS